MSGDAHVRIIESTEHGDVVVTKGAEQIEDREAGLVDDDNLAVVQAGTYRQCRNSRSGPS